MKIAKIRIRINVGDKRSQLVAPRTAGSGRLSRHRHPSQSLCYVITSRILVLPTVVSIILCILVLWYTVVRYMHSRAAQSPIACPADRIPTSCVIVMT